MNTFYLTSSLPYTNAPPHIGFGLEIIQTDVLARYHRQKGEDVFFLTGTDEHGSKVAKTAQEVGITPQEWTDKISARFQELDRALNISNDDFIRTTDRKRHWPSVQEVWRRLQDKGDLYKDVYEGWYCSGCEAFITERELVDGKCPIHQKEPERVQEENWFFPLSKYAPQVKEKIEKEELNIIPQSRKHEMLQLIDQGLQDISFSRPKAKLQWGIPVPGDEGSISYVWPDALTNYLSALGYPKGERFKKYWPADVHVIGKDILRFHATIWPAMLLALGEELPRAIFVHGFITVNGQKMSKSLGNVVDPFELVEQYGADAVRYYFLREIPSTQDGDFSVEKFEARYNGDLAAGLGNLVARVLAMAQRHNPSFEVPPSIADEELREAEEAAQDGRDAGLESFEFSDALEAVWGFIHTCDRYIERKRPWEESPEQDKTLERLVGAVGALVPLLRPLLPETADKIARQLQERSPSPLFPRLD